MPTRYNLDSETGKIKIRKVTDPPKDNQYNSSGGSIISTAPDLLNWLLMIRNGGEHNGNSYLTKASIKAMLSPTKVSRTGAGGLYIREKDETGKAIVYGHSGSSGTNCWINLKHDYIAIVLTQTAFNKGFDFDLQGKISEILNLND